MEAAQTLAVQSIVHSLPYTYKPQVVQDVTRLLQDFPTLRVSNTPFTKEDGRHMHLCCSGTVPISYKGAQYQIPIALWVCEQHPSVPPYVYVIPTDTMLIKPTRNVGSSGQIYHTYLSAWNGQTCTLSALLRVLQGVFGAECPVYAKPANLTSQPQRPPKPDGSLAALGANKMGATPTPTNLITASPTTANHMRSTNGPQLPPKPNASNAPVPPPKPKHLEEHHRSTPSSHNHLSGRATPDYMSEDYGSPRRPFTPPLNQTPPRLDARTARHFALHRAAVERVEGYENSIEREVRAETERCQRMANQLTANRQALDGAHRLIADELTAVREAIQSYQRVNEQLESTLSQQQQQRPPPLDSMVVTTTPLYEQILALVAEENAVIDTIYHLSKALNRGLIDMDTFLKHVRVLSRQQFTTRALIKKARETADLLPV
eukprot:comp11936_c0_seq1/m.6608 comp11936_c0_seq1/g.6608  ORF comp11936_c0_seq1/g.6608 comp11936_c0_seq1/m.6608 type:complete len:433 (-) comp11936_c0_seq1:62-1360(-)